MFKSLIRFACWKINQSIDHAIQDLKKERIIENAQQDLQMFLKSEAGRTELKNKVEYLYEQEENRRLNVARKWNGLGQRPKPHYLSQHDHPLQA